MSELLNHKENEAASKFAWEHYDRCCTKLRNAALQLTATATGLGFSIKVQFPVCKETRNIADTDSW